MEPKPKMDFDPRPFPQGGRPPESFAVGDTVKRLDDSGLNTTELKGTILQVNGLKLLVKWDAETLKHKPQWIDNSLVRKQ